MESELTKFYEQLRADAHRLPSAIRTRLGCPFFSCPPDGWREMANRILIVGQEPREEGGDKERACIDGYAWEHPSLRTLDDVLDYAGSARALMDLHKSQYYGASAWSGAPFEAARKELILAAQKSGGGSATATNLIRCNWSMPGDENAYSMRDATREEREQVMDWEGHAVADENRIISPTGVVFFTGNHDLYETALDRAFPGIVREVVLPERAVDQFAKLRHPDLPELSFRTYHPNYLRRSGRWSWVQDVADLVTGRHAQGQQ